MADVIAGTEDVEKLKDCFPGCKFFVIFASVMISTVKIVFI